MIAASTRRYETELELEERLLRLGDLGFRRFELARPDANPLAVSGEWLSRRSLSIASVDGSGLDLAGLADPDRDRALLALSAAARQASWALRRGSNRVLVEPGSVPLLDAGRREEEAWRIARRGGGAEARKALEDLECVRRGIAEAHVERLCRALHRLRAELPDVIWCLPTPSGPAAIPMLDELQWVFDDLGEKGLAYWHRTFHAERCRELAGVASEEWLARFGGRTAGVELEDAAPGEDEPLLPGVGVHDFRAVAESLPARAERVLVVETAATPVEVEGALDFLRSTGFRME